ncbi:PREDICTED: transmembrane protein 223 [Atta colombica]|nr:PREDICTED: transmembrane protein 223 [Atta colombica]XP_018048868.1 PREDICTED: transmembrane protein 223 [Atta colombica]XP_018048869.1 PREDICTED: transmembrane protein 223 [Atta colombica]XP_018048870.1 PREDICTED: transmembrane protein 223 [Atta colombica]
MLNLILRHPIILKTLTQIRPVHGITQKYFIRDKNIFSAAMTVKMFLTRCMRLSAGATRQTSFLKPNKLVQNLLIRRRQMSQLDVNTNVQNNVILYKFEESRYFRNMQIFGVVQLFSCSVLAFYSYSPSFWDIFKADVNLKEHFLNYMFRFCIFFFAIVTGPLISLYIYATCARSIKYIILNKGGETLSIITYHMQKNKSKLNLPVGMVKCIADRQDERGTYLPLKIKNRSFYYLVNKSGTFVNSKLFDHTMG